MTSNKEKVENAADSKIVRVYCDGIFDLFHSGHSNQFKQVHQHPKLQNCKVVLIVGVCSDKDTLKYKGPTVMTMEERISCIEGCKWVSEIIPNAPWILNEEFLEKNRIDLVAHDDIPYSTPDQDDVYGWIKQKGLFLATQRTEGISTSDLILRIIRNHEMYCKRLIGRGYTAEELNLTEEEHRRLSK